LDTLLRLNLRLLLLLFILIVLLLFVATMSVMEHPVHESGVVRNDAFTGRILIMGLLKVVDGGRR
jgi:hypothetical protein